MSRDFTYVDDIVQGIIITLQNPEKGEWLPVIQYWKWRTSTVIAFY